MNVAGSAFLHLRCCSDIRWALVALLFVAAGSAMAIDAPSNLKLWRSLERAFTKNDPRSLSRLLTPKNIQRMDQGEQADLLIGLINGKFLSGLTAVVHSGINPNMPLTFDREGEPVTYTALNYAIGAHDDAAVAIRLIELGANVNLSSVDDEAPLLTAAGLCSEAVVQRLLSAGADPNVADRLFGLTPLMAAIGRTMTGTCSLASARALVAHGASVNAATVTGHTPLMFAAIAGNAEAVQWLLQAGADSTRIADGGVSFESLQKNPSSLPDIQRLLVRMQGVLKTIDSGGNHE